tara:strand:+ start:658 stop:828 length:171 start_codon:yes stop_codon:yes gene_type:complete
MARYFKKPNGVIVEAAPNHDIASLKSRFVEVDADGKELKKEAPKPKKKSSKKKENK